LFLIMQQLLSTLLLGISSAQAWVLDTIATLLAALIVGVVMLRLVEHRPSADLGFARNTLRLTTPGIVIGAASIATAAVVMVLIGSLRYREDGGTFLQWLIGMLKMLALLGIAAAAEEALFRGYPFQKLVEGLGAVAATIIASAGFAIAHAHNPAVNGFALANIFIAGVMLSIAYLRTRSLWFATGVHVGWNWCMAALLDLPVSGLELFNAPLYEPADRGPAWLSGGSFGPEAGIAGVIGLTLALSGVVWFTRKNSAWQTLIESRS
jgi:uncharacterized protein